MDICLYEDWMKHQVAKLFSVQYGIREDAFAQLIGNFYELPFQKDKCIRIVAKEGDTIIGFQSFFFWPYLYEGREINAYQSGNSLVHPDHRGKGIFQKLLSYLDQHREQLKIDVLIGFPIDASVGSLLRNKWLNIFNLQWFLKMGNPFSILIPVNLKKLNAYFPSVEARDYPGTSSVIKLSHHPSFNAWRATHYDTNNYFSFVYKSGKEELVLKLKINIRKKRIKELIIGDVITSSYQEDFLEDAFHHFLKTARKVRCITVFSIACNVHCEQDLSRILKKCGFEKIKKQIYFCVKPFTQETIYRDPAKWMIFRGDIDTW